MGVQGGVGHGASLRLTSRQEAVVALIAAGLSDKQIALRLGLSRHTVRTHLDRVFEKNGFHNRAQLLMAWLRPTEEGV
jgi:DNA-binding CsgD family transcriptional regulator